MAWLLLSEDLPQRHESDIYHQAYVLGEAVGPVGLALAASVVAYLVGSLVQVGLSSLADGLRALRKRGFRRHWYWSVPPAVAIEDVLSPPLFEPKAIGGVDGDGQTKSRLQSLTEAQLADRQEELLSAVGAAETGDAGS